MLIYFGESQNSLHNNAFKYFTKFGSSANDVLEVLKKVRVVSFITKHSIRTLQTKAEELDISA